VYRTQDEIPFLGEEGVRLPMQRIAGMRAHVPVGEHCLAHPYDETVVTADGVSESEPPRVPVAEIIEPADNETPGTHVARFGSTPPGSTGS